LVFRPSSRGGSKSSPLRPLDAGIEAAWGAIIGPGVGATADLLAIRALMARGKILRCGHPKIDAAARIRKGALIVIRVETKPTGGPGLSEREDD
jgi:hypothetical protein